MSDNRSLIDTILANKLRSFHKTQGFVTGIINFHKLVAKLPLKIFYIEMFKGLKKQLSFETRTVG